jgi:hypothetical protein
MFKGSVFVGTVASCLLCWSAVAAAATPEQILQYRPKQEGINYTTPAADQIAACKVKWTKNPQQGGVWMLLDPQGRPLRRLVDSNGDNKPDIWCYYLDGIEVYREIDSDFDGEPDQYRWLNSAGMKWGVALNRDHKISSWRMISAEEVSQEIVQAIISKDFSRIQALFITEAEMKALNLPTDAASQITQQQQQAAAKFQSLASKLGGFGVKTHWVHLETGPPQCLPADTYGTKMDLIKYPRGTILCETDGKHDFIQTGEMIKVGLTWRLVDVPSAGDGGDPPQAALNPMLQGLLDHLRDYDARAPKSGEPAEMATYSLGRADLLEKIVGNVKPEEREQWYRQVADCLNTASQNGPEGEKLAYPRLLKLEEALVAAVPGSPLAAYVTFREMQADNAAKLSKPNADINKVQEQWIERLTRFVETYQRAEDSPEVLMQLGMTCEFVNKDIPAKKWYGILAKDFADHPLAVKAQGALRRLDLEGKPIELAGDLVGGGKFNIADLAGKTIIVYYWASWNKQRCVADFAVLKQLLNNYGGKGLELVGVNLDNTEDEAKAFLQQTPAPGVHLFGPGGIDGPLATQYGVTVLPNMFLVDKAGKVLSRRLQVGNVEDELKKLLK